MSFNALNCINIYQRLDSVIPFRTMKPQQPGSYDDEFKRYKFATDFVIIWLIRRGQLLDCPDVLSITEKDIEDYLRWSRLPRAQKAQLSSSGSRSLIPMARNLLLPIVSEKYALKQNREAIMPLTGALSEPSASREATIFISSGCRPPTPNISPPVKAMEETSDTHHVVT